MKQEPCKRAFGPKLPAWAQSCFVVEVIDMDHVLGRAQPQLDAHQDRVERERERTQPGSPGARGLPAWA